MFDEREGEKTADPIFLRPGVELTEDLLTLSQLAAVGAMSVQAWLLSQQFAGSLPVKMLQNLYIELVVFAVAFAARVLLEGFKAFKTQYLHKYGEGDECFVAGEDLVYAIELSPSYSGKAEVKIFAGIVSFKFLGMLLATTLTIVSLLTAKKFVVSGLSLNAILRSNLVPGLQYQLALTVLGAAMLAVGFVSKLIDTFVGSGKERKKTYDERSSRSPSRLGCFFNEFAKNTPAFLMLGGTSLATIGGVYKLNPTLLLAGLITLSAGCLSDHLLQACEKKEWGKAVALFIAGIGIGFSMTAGVSSLKDFYAGKSLPSAHAIQNYWEVGFALLVGSAILYTINLIYQKRVQKKSREQEEHLKLWEGENYPENFIPHDPSQ